jgi:hypothetical protein
MTPFLLAVSRNADHDPSMPGLPENVRLLKIDDPTEFTRPFPTAEYALLLIAREACITPDVCGDLPDRIVRSGCRYAVCVGPGSSRWDDAIDWVVVMDEVGGHRSTLVMTTWHDDEGLDATVDFFFRWASSIEWEPEQFLILIIRGTDADEEEVRRLVAD